MATRDRSLSVAAAQVVAAPLSGAGDALSAATRPITRAAEQRVDLVVLPECTYPAYCIESVQAYRRAPKLSPDAYVAELRGLPDASGCTS
ncbi:MAG: hypothetical protein ACPMAQ_11565 [Phycisphaerae bacterium]